MLKALNANLKTDSARLEFWLVSGFILISLLISTTDAIQNDLVAYQNGQRISILSLILFNHLVTFISYLLLCFNVAPSFEGEKGHPSISLFVFMLIAGCYMLGIIAPSFAALLAIKILVVIFHWQRQNREHGVYYESALLTATWLLICVGSGYLSTPQMLAWFLRYNLPADLIIYLVAVHYLLPGIAWKKLWLFRYISKILLLIVLSAVIWAVSMINNSKIGLPLMIINFLVQLFIVAPVALVTFKRRKERKEEEIVNLKTELGKSDANLTFLKSQINPHFLFNALNTLYGTALNENAELTSEGIQKLGDMMRFMLQENLKDKIPLVRDMDYLKNYIVLQKLRTSASTTITIESQIEEYCGNLLITPMLLIPFVENAFKHGISLLHLSHIKISLQTNGNTLYFDVQNSVHERHDEAKTDESGIGLENVKQRLQLLYPGKHELIIRESANEFFIHLTVELDINN